MANKIDTFTTRIFLNDSDAKEKIAKLQKDVEKFRKEMYDAADAGKWDDFKVAKENLNKATKELDSMKTSAQKVSSVLNNLKTSSYKELQQTVKAINKELRSGAVARNSDEWKRLNEYLRQCRNQLNFIKEEGKATEPWFKRIPKFFNDNWGVITQAIGSITGLSLTVRKCVSEFAKMEDVMANTRKYTGMTDESVRELNEDFKGMNTRSSREQLNEFAGAAGRLGITSKKSIEEFVDAADKISVALGDDLGDGAVDQIGKLAMAFGEDKNLGLRGAMLATGSAVNELSQSSAASAGYLVDFTARLAGVGKQAGMTQQQIMAMASVLDSNMQEDETSATALSQLITKMSQDPAKFAMLAGKSIKEFTELVKNDMNEALLQFFDAMKSKGGFSELAPMFDGMGLSGTRAVGVLSVMADKINDIRKAQEDANKAYSNGSSVLDEFNIQNGTVQAELDKAKKRFNELVIELGEKLIPVARNAITLTNVGIRLLSVIVNFVIQYKGALMRLGAYLTVYIAIQNALLIKEKFLYAVKMLNLAVDKAMTIAANAAKVATIAWNAAVILLTRGFKGLNAYMRICRKEAMTNPYTALATTLLTLSVVIIELVKNWDKLTGRIKTSSFEFQKNQAIAKDMKDVHDQMKESISDEAGRTQRLYDIVKSSAYTYQQRKNAIAQLQKIVPNYHASLTREGVLHEENAKAIADHINALNDLAMAQALQDKLQKIQGDKFEAWQKLQTKQNNVRAVHAELQRHPEYYNAKETVTYENNGETYTSTRLSKPGRDKRWELLAQQKAEQNAQKEYDVQLAREKEIKDYLASHKSVREQYYTLQTTSTFANGGTVGDGGGNGRGNGGGSSTTSPASGSGKTETLADKQKKKFEKELKLAKEANDKLQAENVLAYGNGTKLYRQYIEDQHSIAMQGIDEQIKIYQKYKQDYSSLSEDKAKEEESAQSDHENFLLLDSKLFYQKQVMEAKKAYDDKNDAAYQDEDTLNEKLFEAEMTYLADQLVLQKEGTEKWFDIKAEMEEKEQEHASELNKKYLDRLAQYRADWGKKDAKEQERIAIKGLDDLHAKGLVKETEYQEMLLAIKRHYALEQSKENLEESKGETFKKESHNLYETASNNAKADYQDAHPEGENAGDYLTSDVTIYASTLDKIKQMEQEGLYSHQQAMAAMGEATAQMCSGMAEKMQAAYDAISPIMDGMSSYYSAQCDLEVTQTQKKYEKLIDKAGNNSAKQKKLEEKQQKEIAKIKTKYNRKQVKMQIAQAIAQSAMSAISAYASVMAGAPWPANQVLAPIAAGLALAAGAIQIATIKKQAQAEEAGYYRGGFTDGKDYHREAGVVHQGEFVANHVAVNNPQLLPAFRLIDQAQRNNTVGSLTASEVSQSMGIGGATVVSAPSVIVNQDNSEIAGTLLQARDTLERLGALLEDGVNAVVTIDGPNGLDKQYRRFKKLKENV